LDRIRARYLLGRGAGPDFELEDGSVAEAKGSGLDDVGAVLRQVAEYYLKRTAVAFVAPADALSLDRAFRLLMLECMLKGMKYGGRASESSSSIGRRAMSTRRSRSTPSRTYGGP
jgi:hypothetical protein